MHVVEIALVPLPGKIEPQTADGIESCDGVSQQGISCFGYHSEYPIKHRLDQSRSLCSIVTS
jgi:hypothetical protein